MKLTRSKFRIMAPLLVGMTLAGSVVYSGCSNHERDNPFDEKGANWHPPSVTAMSDTTVALSDSFFIHATASDANGTVKKYLWALDGVNFKDSTDSGRIETAFTTAGVKTVKVIARDNDGVVSQPDSCAITVLPPPTLISPADSATGQPLSPTLTWSSVSEATTYHVQVARDTTFTSIFAQDSTLTDTSMVVSGLASNTTYYWRVRAKNAGGGGGWSSAWSFTTTTLFFFDDFEDGVLDSSFWYDVSGMSESGGALWGYNGHAYGTVFSTTDSLILTTQTYAHTADQPTDVNYIYFGFANASHSVYIRHYAHQTSGGTNVRYTDVYVDGSSVYGINSSNNIYYKMKYTPARTIDCYYCYDGINWIFLYTVNLTFDFIPTYTGYMVGTNAPNASGANFFQMKGYSNGGK